MIASDRVVMRDGPAVRNDCVERRALDGAPLCFKLARLPERVESEIGRGAVGIDMREPASDLPLAAGCLTSVAALIASWNSLKRSQVIEVSSVSLITPRRISRSIA